MDLNTPPALAGAGERNAPGGQSPPTGVFCTVYASPARQGALSLYKLSGASVSESLPRSALGKAIRHRDDHPRHVGSNKRQHPPTTRTKAVFSLESEGFLLTRQKETSQKWVAGTFVPASPPCGRAAGQMPPAAGRSIFRLGGFVGPSHAHGVYAVLVQPVEGAAGIAAEVDVKTLEALLRAGRSAGARSSLCRCCSRIAAGCTPRPQ